MVFHTYKIERYEKLSNGSYSTTPELLTDVITCSVTEGLGTKADTFSYSIFNDGNGFDSVKINDRIIIYKSLDGSTFTQLIDGLIEQKTITRGVDNNTVTFTGMNRLEKLFNSLVQTTGENIARTADYWIRLILDQVNDKNDLKITWHPSNPSLSSTYAISFVRDYVQAFTLIEELSQPEMTDGKFYVYYIDADNRLVWIPRPEDVNSSPVFGDDFKELSVSKGIWDTVNAFIMYCGTAPFGMGITQFHYDVLSVNENGWKMKPVLAQKLSEDLQGIEWAKMKANNVYSDGSRFPTAYPYVMTDSTSVSSDAEFNAHFVEIIISQSKNRADQLLRRLAQPQFRTRGDYVYDKSSSLADSVEVFFDDVGWGNDPKQLRTTVLNHTFSSKGWVVSFSIDQDTDKAAIDLDS